MSRFDTERPLATQFFYAAIKHTQRIEKEALALEPHMRYKLENGMRVRLLPYNHLEEVNWRSLEVAKTKIRAEIRKSKVRDRLAYKKKPLSYRIGCSITRGLASLGL